MFIDEVQITVIGGRGGNGIVSFRREKYEPHGGPYGGDGGDGGDVMITVDPNSTTLLDFQYKSHFRAESGEHGGGKNRDGQNGQDCMVKVPPGTVVYDADTGAKVADLTYAGQMLLAARGGEGGRGNTAFATATRQAPRFAENGLPGESHRLRLELRLIADVGIVGLANVGKSTLIARISAAKPKIAPYPFTTLVPNLGVVQLEEGRSLVVADMPGLIEGAHKGKGLGHQFLRHIQRTRLLVHLLDAAAVDGREPLDDYRQLNHELEAYDRRLAMLPQIIALNKIDLPTAQHNLPACLSLFRQQQIPAFPISAVTGEGVLELVGAVAQKLEVLRESELVEEGPERFEIAPAPERKLQIFRAGEGVYVVRGTHVETLLQRAKLETADGVRRLHEQLRSTGVLERLEQAGVTAGDTVFIGELELEYAPDM